MASNSMCLRPTPWLGLCLCAAALVSAAFAGEIRDDVNLIAGGDFEHGLKDWWPPAKEGTFLDEQVKHAGRHSLRLERGAKPRHVSRGTAIDPTRSYRLSVWIKASTPERDKPVQVQALEFGHGKPIGWHRQTNMVITGGTHDWRRLEVVLQGFRAGADTVAVYCQLDMGSEGTVWFDDLSLVQIPLPRYEVRLATDRPANLFIGDTPVRVQASVTCRKRAGTGTLKLRATDFWGQVVAETAREVDLSAAKTAFTFSLPKQRGHFDVQAVLEVAAKAQAAATTSAASVDAFTPEQLAASRFGSQVGDQALMPPAGMGWARCCAYWRYLEKTKGEFDEASVRRMIAQAKKHGLKILLNFQNLPRWASTAAEGDPQWERYPPRDWSEWAGFVEHVARLCRDDVDVYETWNEPIIPWGWKGTLEDVYTLHRVTYDAIKRVDRAAVVIGPCICSGVIDKPQMDDFKTWLELGLGKCIDGVSLHPYRLWRKPEAATWRAPFAEDLERVRSLARSHDASQDLWITEIGWSTKSGEYKWETGVTERQQAEYLARAAVFALAAGVKCFITHNLTDYDSAKPYQAGFGLLRLRAASPKPAYVAHATLSRMLSGARFVRRLSLPDPSSLGYCFATAHGEVWVLWDHEKRRQVSLPVAGPRATVVDLMGVEVPGQVERGRLELDLRGEPVFVKVGR